MDKVDRVDLMDGVGPIRLRKRVGVVYWLPTLLSHWTGTALAVSKACEPASPEIASIYEDRKENLGYISRPFPGSVYAPVRQQTPPKMGAEDGGPHPARHHPLGGRIASRIRPALRAAR
jgi:hypothetical protein